jgi:hypothetical protein
MATWLEGIEMSDKISFAAIHKGYEQSIKDLETVHLQRLCDIEMRHQWSKQELAQDLSTRLREAYALLCYRLRKWLDEANLTEFFRTVRDEYDGKLNVYLETVAYPIKFPGTFVSTIHPVHFREGMAVRNKLRDLTGCEWSAIEYDDRWVELVLEAIRE